MREELQSFEWRHSRSTGWTDWHRGIVSTNQNEPRILTGEYLSDSEEFLSVEIVQRLIQADIFAWEGLLHRTVASDKVSDSFLDLVGITSSAQIGNIATGVIVIEQFTAFLEDKSIFS